MFSVVVQASFLYVLSIVKNVSTYRSIKTCKKRKEIADELSKMLNGKVGFNDTIGGGATFYITIPLK